MAREPRAVDAVVDEIKEPKTMPGKSDNDDHRKISEREHKHDDEQQSPILIAIFNELRGIRIEAGEIGVQLGCIHKHFRDLLRSLECSQQKPKERLFVFREGADEPIMKGKMEVTLSKPIAPGFRRSFEVGTDEAIDARPDGTFAKSEVVEGDSRAPDILPTSTNKSIKGWIYGDGSIGTKLVRVTVDGHVGDGDVPITLDIRYEVASKDATEFVGFTEGATDEAIPT